MRPGEVHPPPPGALHHQQQVIKRPGSSAVAIAVIQSSFCKCCCIKSSNFACRWAARAAFGGPTPSFTRITSNNAFCSSLAAGDGQRKHTAWQLQHPPVSHRRFDRFWPPRAAVTGFHGRAQLRQRRRRQAHCHRKRRQSADSLAEPAVQRAAGGRRRCQDWRCSHRGANWAGP